MASLSGGLVNPDAYSRHSPFGIMFEKRWIFEQGGHPVIYQADAEFNLLPELIGWRHVRYEPNRTNPIDFPWEREWRIQWDSLQFNPSVAAIVVLNRVWAQRMIDEHEAEQDFRVLMYREALDEDLAELYREEFP